jgi:hypothetical protein
MWRLRTYKEDWYTRFWIKLARYAGQGKAGKLQTYGDANIPERMVVGDKKRIEYRLRGIDRRFLPRKSYTRESDKIKVKVIRPKDFDPKRDPQTPAEVLLSPKPNARGDDDGWFMADFPIMTPGEYKFELKVPTTPEVIRTTVSVDRPNPELDNLRPDPNRLYRVASENERVFSRVSDEAKRKLKELKGPQEEGESGGNKDGKRLYFDLESAELIPELMRTEVKKERTKGTSIDLWDKGWDTGWEVFGEPFRFSWVMIIIVGLLSAEWLTRKLLKLA